MPSSTFWQIEKFFRHSLRPTITPPHHPTTYNEHDKEKGNGQMQHAENHAHQRPGRLSGAQKVQHLHPQAKGRQGGKCPFSETQRKNARVRGHGQTWSSRQPERPGADRPGGGAAGQVEDAGDDAHQRVGELHKAPAVLQVGHNLLNHLARVVLDLLALAEHLAHAEERNDERKHNRGSAAPAGGHRAPGRANLQLSQQQRECEKARQVEQEDCQLKDEQLASILVPLELWRGGGG